MAQRSQYFDAVSGDITYNSADFARHFETITNNGYVKDANNELQVTETSPTSLAVEVNTGIAWVEGRYFEVYNEAEELELDDADPTDDRIDRIVVQLDLDNKIVDLKVLTGTPAASPTAPSLTRTSTIYELSLAQILVGAGVTTIGDTDITDERDDGTLCGVSSPPAGIGGGGLEGINYYLKLEGDLSLNSTSPRDIEWDDEIYDSDNIFTVPDTDITIPETGLWLLIPRIEIGIFPSPDSTVYAAIDYQVNSTTQETYEQYLDVDTAEIDNYYWARSLPMIKYLQDSDVISYQIRASTSFNAIAWFELLYISEVSL